ncbi:alpha/beta hydrolase [Paraburkholderia sp. J41]|uniref:alpha/beta fold hydrolase n=1 Tax=Paraburkholderia sp. J41 TaxID=2805433 RepID=UPI002AC3211B|nr:alpha/beta hydrolase [Paraburkholderia sp. J41]
MPFVAANQVDTFYRSMGEGPPLLLIAGNGMDHTCFDEQLRQFAPYFTCIVYDLRGVGASSITVDGYTTAGMAKDALALLDALGIESAHVGGYSLGGAIGQELAICAPKRVKSLSLYASYDRPDPYLRLRYDILVDIVEHAMPAMWALFSAFSAFGTDYINANETTVRNEIAKRAARWQGDSAPSRTGLIGHYRAILSHDTSARLDQIRCPTWIAVGTDDPVMPPSYAERLHRGIHGSTLDIFDGSPHRILNFNADAFTQKALAFLLAQT